MIGSKITVIGAGGWGTAMAILLAFNNSNVTLWTHNPEIVDNIKHKQENSIYLPNVKIPDNVLLTNDVNEIEQSDIVVNGIPTQYIRTTVEKYQINLKNKLIVNGAKGIEVTSLKRISEVFKDIAYTAPENYAVLTGPSHAEEAATKHPTTVVVASANQALSQKVQSIFNSNFFRVYTSNDVIGAEIGGALKNVVAIAAGIIDGIGMGDNTKAALITRGLAEMSRLGISLGANPLTFSGLSGLGDLFVTCNSKLSRNRRVGELIGKGMSLEQILAEMKMVAEGVQTTVSAYNLSLQAKVDMPITQQMYKILFENIKPIDAINELMSRESKQEWW
ncbi:MAG TPA: NAD(P)H-dependent glycerol-3-phosphate dehydrogenase [Candidatus Kapabacteria bacterium]|nr:NAD(P)H-dependent glycerol-3-phosphate dehydrogenase [Candidatus Kapabacteria bacterium]